MSRRSWCPQSIPIDLSVRVIIDVGSFHGDSVAAYVERYPEAQACAKPCPPAELIEMLGVAVDEAAAH